MRPILLALVLSLISINMAARSVSGIVVSDRDSTAVPGAACRLTGGGGACAAGDDGRFALDTDSREAATLEVSAPGYSPTEIRIPAGTKSIDLGRVYLSEAALLEGLTVTARSATDARGRTIVYPSAADLRSAASSIGLLRLLPLPGLEANPINRSVSVDGGSPVILIDGIPSTIDDLNSLAPGDIARVEYSRVTPPRYADRGSSGLLSLTLRRRTDGGQVYLWGRSAVTTAFMDGNFRASYHQGPSQLSMSYNPSWRNYARVFDTRRESYIGDDFRVDLDSHDRNPFNYHYHQLRARYDYSPSAATLFSATVNVMPSYSGRRLIGHTVDSHLGEYDERNHTTGSSVAPSLDLFFRHDFDSSNSLEAQVVGTLSYDKYRRDFTYIYTDGSTDSYINDVDSRRHSLISEVAYTHTFAGATELSAGVQNTVSRSTNRYITTDYKPLLTENNNYIYARAARQFGPVYLSLSTGLKLFWIKNDLNRRRFIRNLTQAQMQWTIDPRWTLAASFDYRPSIPSLSQLTDYPQQTSPYLISNGNPDLRVARSFTYRLAPTFRHDKLSASLQVAYSHTSDAVIRDMTYLGDRHFLSQSVNARRSNLLQTNLFMRLAEIRGFGAVVSLGYSRYYCAGEGWHHSLGTFSANFSVWYTHGPVTVQYWRKVPGKYLDGHQVGKDENGDMLSVDWNPDKHWSLGAQWWYMFDVKGTRYPSWSSSPVNPSVAERHISPNGNMVVLTATYTADFGAIFRTARRSLNNSDSSSSLLKL